jgi:hypothetical protein
MRLYIGPGRESVETPALDDPVFDGLSERWTAVRIYGWATPGILEAMKPGRMPGHGGTEEVSG